MNKALLIALLLVVLSQTAVVIYAMMAQQKQLHDLKVEMTEIRIQVRAEFHRIQELLDKKELLSTKEVVNKIELLDNRETGQI